MSYEDMLTVTFNISAHHATFAAQVGQCRCLTKNAHYVNGRKLIISLLCTITTDFSAESTPVRTKWVLVLNQRRRRYPRPCDDDSSYEISELFKLQNKYCTIDKRCLMPDFTLGCGLFNNEKKPRLIPAVFSRVKLISMSSLWNDSFPNGAERR